MKSQLTGRKRIWKVDCRSLEIVIAASFEWRELFDVLKGSFRTCSSNENVLETQMYALVHQCCHSNNSASRKLEFLLNYRYQRFIEAVCQMDPSEVLQWVLSYSFGKKPGLAGITWAIGSDAREGFDCIRRHFHQRLQIYSVRKLL
ncbi:MAG: hypothetical protein HY351_04010 [Candidatus Omnitrophica bacterium]|nr:hypothetical protein [Candidatus Omnitrophota bacterium]